MSTASEHYADMVKAWRDQTNRVGERGDSWDAAAGRFRQDPRRPFDMMLSTIAAYLHSDDLLLDIGGGAGRYSLPLASLCREVVNVEPSTGMGETFLASARDAEIANVRWIHGDWLSSSGVEGDVSLVANVTYFVEDIVPFIEKLTTASRRRVIIGVVSVPQPNQGAAIFETLYGEEQAPVPGHRELLSVLWDLGILPEVRVLDQNQAVGAAQYSSRDDAIYAQLPERMSVPEKDRARQALAERFESLFVEAGGIYRRRAPGTPRQLLLTWETRA